MGTLAGFLSDVEVLSEASWPVRWMLPLSCLVPLLLTWVAVQAVRNHAQPDQE